MDGVLGKDIVASRGNSHDARVIRNLEKHFIVSTPFQGLCEVILRGFILIGLHYSTPIHRNTWTATYTANAKPVTEMMILNTIIMK